MICGIRFTCYSHVTISSLKAHRFTILFNFPKLKRKKKDSFASKLAYLELKFINCLLFLVFKSLMMSLFPTTSHPELFKAVLSVYVKCDHYVKTVVRMHMCGGEVEPG